MTATRLTASSGSSSGLPGGWIDVTASPYSAVGDGTTDDTAAIQSAINAIQTNGGTVYFPTGKTFKITSTLTCNDNGRPIVLKGGAAEAWSQINDGSPILNYTGSTGSLLQCHSSLSLTLLGLRFTYSNTAYTGAGTYLVDFDWSAAAADCQLSKVLNCSFNSTFAVNPANGAQSLLRLNKFIIGEVANCHFGAAQEGIRVADPGGTYVVASTIHNCTFNFSQSAHIMIGSGDAEAITIRDCAFEGCPSNGAIYGNSCQTYSLVISNNWFGDSSAPVGVPWINNVVATGNNYTGVIGPGNRFAANDFAMKLAGDWLVMGNTVETGKGYKTSTMTLTDICNYYAIVDGANIFEAGHPPSVWKVIGSHSAGGHLNNADTLLNSAVHIGGYGGASGFDTVNMTSSGDWGQLSLGVHGTNGSGVVASSPHALIYADYNTAYGGAGTLRLQAPGVQASNEVQLIAGTVAPAPLVRASGNGLAFYNTAPIAQASRAGQLTDSTGGTVTSTLAAGISDAVAKNAIASLAAKVNALETVIHNLGLSA